MKITKEMINEFNETLEYLNCIFRIEYSNSILNNPEGKIIIANDFFVCSATINLSSEFYAILEAFFYKKGIELSYNNDRNIFWSKSGFD